MYKIIITYKDGTSDHEYCYDVDIFKYRIKVQTDDNIAGIGVFYGESAVAPVYVFYKKESVLVGVFILLESLSILECNIIGYSPKSLLQDIEYSEFRNIVFQTDVGVLGIFNSKEECNECAKKLKKVKEFIQKQKDDLDKAYNSMIDEIIKKNV